MRTIFAYIFRETVMPLLACTAACVFLWVIYDMFDNFGDFVEAKAPAAQIIEFYWQQVPRAIAISLEVAVLLATLYCLLSMSRTSELTAMQACGISPWQIAAPIVIVAILATLLQTWLNWEWSPQAVRNRELIIEEFRSMREIVEQKREQRTWQHQRTVQVRAVVYRSRDTRRLWFIYRAEMTKWQLSEVEIIQLAPDGVDLWKIYARTGTWDGRTWRFHDVIKVEYDPQGNAIRKDEMPVYSDPALTESFEQVTSTVRSPDVLSVPELIARINENADLGEARLAPFRTYLSYRLSAGLSCLAAAFMALPFGMMAARRNLFAGFGKGMMMYLAFFTVKHFFVAMGKGNRVPGPVAGAGPVLFFLAVGFALFWLKTSGSSPADWLPGGRRKLQTQVPSPALPPAVDQAATDA